MTTKLKSQLEAAREALAAALSASHAGDQQLAKLERARAGGAAEIEQLEGGTEANPDNEDGIARLQTLRESNGCWTGKSPPCKPITSAAKQMPGVLNWPMP